jgi:hypothetical protein
MSSVTCNLSEAFLRKSMVERMLPLTIASPETALICSLVAMPSVERPAIWYAFTSSTRDLLLGARHAEPFLVEQKGRYGLAHIRRVVQALGNVDLNMAVQNVVELLSMCEPGQ